MKRITVYKPGNSFPSVSVTGGNCAMSCAHCSGKYLAGMKDVSGEGDLYNFGLRLWKNGGKGILISGGCDTSGAVVFPDHTFKEIRRIKEETGLLINLHCGLVDDGTAELISASGVDKVSFDLVYDNDTIRDVLHLDRKKEDYIDTIDRLLERGIKVVPHILAGLNKGAISWEFSAIDMISEKQPDEVVLIVLIPTKGTPFQNLDPPSMIDLLGLARKMRDTFKGRVVLGCMRPKDDPGLEVEVIKAGFNGIVLPRRSTVKWLISQGYEIETKEICCCM